MPQNREAAQLLHNFIHKYGISPPNTYTEMKEEQVRLFFQQGQALFERNWPYAWALHQQPDSPVKGRVGIAPLPGGPTGQRAATLGGWHIGLSQHTDAEEEAMALIGSLASYEVQKQLVMRLGWNPGRRDVYKDGEVLEKHPHLAQLQEVFSMRCLDPWFPITLSFLRFFKNPFTGFWPGSFRWVRR